MTVARWLGSMAAVGLFGLAMTTVPAGAQRGGPCLVQLDSVGGMGRSIEISAGSFHQFGSGGVWARCLGEPTAMRSDSVAWYSDRNRIDFIGNVHFQDSVVDLDASLVTYFLSDDHLEAYGDVELVNRDAGSRLNGPELTYYRRREGVRDTTELFAPKRPLVHYVGGADPTGALEPYVIVGDRVRLKGNSTAWVGGAVRVTRSDFEAEADSATLDLEADRGQFLGHAQVEGRGEGEYTLSGRRIDFRLEDRSLSWVRSVGVADAMSSEWRLLADTIEFELGDDRIQTGLAWGDSLRPRALSIIYTFTADSLAIDSPNQRLREVRGFRDAYATSRSELVEGIDWMRGDSLVARFDTLSTGPLALVALDARGNARALYHVEGETGSGPPGVTYSRGSWIAATFEATGLERIDVRGEGDGVYLEPVGGPEP